MKKEHPLFIESLTKDIEEALKMKKKAEADVNRERQDKCPHVHHDGRSAWIEYYAYGACEICGYSDM